MWNNCLRSGGGGLLGGRLRIFFVSMYGSKLGVSEGSIGITMVFLKVGETGVAVLV